ncbi:MAG TPA: type II toxin-antitoxin system RelE/ParE family toxin [Longimicrobiales bacterium]|nr:type II toxin-antitoxin system RelE/ParE family toxin [Longimicrobiales bacterium]
MRIVWSPTARKRARAAVDHIRLDRPQAAYEWLDWLVHRIELLPDFPEQGRVVPEWHEPAVREVFHEPYRIIYEVLEDRMEILTLSHLRQQLPPGPPGSSS